MLGPLIRKLEAYAPLSADDRRALDRAAGPFRHHARGSDILRRGEPGPHIHVIVDGWACRTAQLEDGQSQITAFLLPGDLCSPFGSLRSQADCAVQALTPVSVAAIPFAGLRQLAARHPAVERALWHDLEVTLAVQRAWLVNVGRRQGAERLGHLLCELHARLRAVGLGEADGFALPATQEVLAGALGMTTVHLSRTAKSLRMRGLLRLEARHVTFPDLPALRSASGFNPRYLAPDRAQAADLAG